MTATTTTTPSATKRFDLNEFYREYLRDHEGMFPTAIRYNDLEYTKHEAVGIPEYFTSTKRNWLAGVRAIQLIGLQQATEVSL